MFGGFWTANGAKVGCAEEGRIDQGVWVAVQGIGIDCNKLMVKQVSRKFGVVLRWATGLVVGG